jgi:MoCo/4Fe-4S cofactor protein with predicted Tat translocation signal
VQNVTIKMKSKKLYWKGIEQLNSESAIVEGLENNEFVEKLPVNSKEENDGASRRDFLKYVGFSSAAAALAGCEGPVIKSVPYVVQPEQIIPGVANYYATTIADGNDFSSILVKTREGRPIKIESNKDASSFGDANARVHASVLSLYDANRIQGPKISGEYTDWDTMINLVKVSLQNFKDQNKKVVLLTQTYPSPTTNNIIKELLDEYPNVSHVIYDTISDSSVLDAFENIYGIRAMADYDFSKAENIISIDADFLSDWQGGGYSAGYTKTRVPDKSNNKKMSYHLQFESNMTLTGSNADDRVPAKPSELKKIVARIYSRLSGNGEIKGSLTPEIDKYIDLSIERILSSPNKSVVVSGIDDVEIQELILQINRSINSEAIDINNPRLIRQGNNTELNEFISELNSGEISGVITSGVNPLYSLPNSESVKQSFENLEFSLVFSEKEDETAKSAMYVAASNNYLESWGDYEFKKGNFFLAQPTIRPLFDTIQFQDFFLKLLGSNVSFYERIKSNWQNTILKGKTWGKSLQDGYYNDFTSLNLRPRKLSASISSISEDRPEEFSLVLYSKTGIGDGSQSSNPWLQEFPDPITRVTWDNYLTISASDANKLGLKNYNVSNGALNGSYANISDGENQLKVPVLIQPGQANGTVGLAYGYGKTEGMKDVMKVGVNAYTFYNNFSKTQTISISKVKGDHEFACIQLHNTMMGRDEIIKETDIDTYNSKEKSYWNPTVMVSKNHIETKVTSKEVDIWREFDRSTGHHFNLSIDLNACNGCGACVIACHAENNVPVVGKEEVRKSRDMHWLRIDRYFSSEDTFEGDVKAKEGTSGYREYRATQTKLETAAENPKVVFQPVMCQHCNHAPCETVCPVAATSHGRQGQNQMAYNRCVGTRYCANNCPYKVRRFNWFAYAENDEFDYNMNNDLGRMVLNPDVNVRGRGVMEKCSLCIQMTQKTILDAKKDGRRVVDGEFQTACSNACSDGAIVFGDINDKDSKISELNQKDRAYRLLESIGTKPNVLYQVKVTNSKKV